MISSWPVPVGILVFIRTTAGAGPFKITAMPSRINTKGLLLIMALLLPFLARTQLDTLLVDSKILGNRFIAYHYQANGNTANQPIIYFTDGSKLIEQGFVATIQELEKQKLIPFAHYVFISSKDFDTGIDLRNDWFFCKPAYLAFFETELIPVAEEHWQIDAQPSSRYLVGVSFGGLNAAYFSSQSRQFAGYALLSPITYPCPDLNQYLAFSPNEGLKLYLSTGQFDAENYLSPLVALYQQREHQILQEQTNGGHDFENWRGQLKTMIPFLIGPKP